MRRHRSHEEDEDDEEVEEEDDEEDEPESRSARRRGRRGHRGAGRSTVRPWRAGAEGEEHDEEEPPPELGWFGRPKKPVFWRARDSLWFEPLVALAVVVLLVVGLWAYTQNWPPIYVVESDSMQHGPVDQLGLLNTGDLVLAQKVDPGTVTTYMVGLESGYTTYGESGDVVLYHPNGDRAATPVIHRPLVYLVHNPDATWSVPELAGFACSAGAHPYYAISSTPTGCGTSHIMGTLTLYNIGWQSATVALPLGSLGASSGFVTMGDNNYLGGHPAQGEPDQTAGISSLVNESWVIGVARGMLPWFGAFTLLFNGQASMVPSQSWQYIGVVLATVLLGGLGVHLMVRSRESEEEGEEGGPTLRERLTGWLHRDEEDGPEEEEPSSTSQRRPRPVSPLRKKDLLRHAQRPGGRPKPTVRRTHHRGPAHRERGDSRL